MTGTPDAAGLPRPAVALRGRLAREFRTIGHMVALYCRAHHAAAGLAPCPSCSAFLDYARRRLQKCPYGAAKPTCANCPVHCYKPAPRAFARAMMRYAGPRMSWRHPWLALLHTLDGYRRVDHPLARRRGRRPPDARA